METLTAKNARVSATILASLLPSSLIARECIRLADRGVARIPASTVVKNP